MFQLTLEANNGELVRLKYDTMAQANAGKEAFMMTGQYRDGRVQRLCPECGEIGLSRDQDICGFCDPGEGMVG